MQNKNHEGDKRKVYYVPGSELIPVPFHSLGEVPRLRNEHHESEVRHAVFLATALKRA